MVDLFEERLCDLKVNFKKMYVTSPGHRNKLGGDSAGNCGCQKYLTLSCLRVDVFLNIDANIKDAWKYSMWVVMVASFETDVFILVCKGIINEP